MHPIFTTNKKYYHKWKRSLSKRVSRTPVFDSFARHLEITPRNHPSKSHLEITLEITPRNHPSKYSSKYSALNIAITRGEPRRDTAESHASYTSQTTPRHRTILRILHIANLAAPPQNPVTLWKNRRDHIIYNEGNIAQRYFRNFKKTTSWQNQNSRTASITKLGFGLIISSMATVWRARVLLWFLLKPAGFFCKI